MASPSKQLRKQAEKARAAALRAEDPEHAKNMEALADAFRAQADAIKAAKKSPKSKNK